MQSSEVGKLARAGFGWLAVGRAATQLVHLANSIILARLLVPEDFGLMAMAIAVGGVARAVGDFGVSAIVVQRDEISPRFLDAAFTLNITVFVGIGLVQVLLAPLGSYLMKEPRVSSVMVGLATALPFSGVGAFYQALLRRELRFARVVTLNLLKVTVMTVVACTLAGFGYGVWSLVVGALVSSIFLAVFGRKLVDLRPGIDRKALEVHRREIVDFGKFATGNSLINYLVNNADYLLVGRVLSTSSLGLYSFAYERSRLISARILELVSSVSFPAFSRLKSSGIRLRDAYVKITLGGFAVIAPATIFLAAHAQVLIPFVFGDKWTPAVLAFQILSLHVLFNAATSGGGSILYAVGRPDVSFRVMRWMVVPLMVSYYAGARIAGIEGVAMAVVLVKSATSALFMWTVFRHMGWSAWLLLKPLMLVVVGSLLAAAGSTFVAEMLAPSPEWITLFVAGGVFGFLYAVIELSVNRKGVRLVWQGLLGDSGASWCRERLPRAVRTFLAMPV